MTCPRCNSEETETTHGKEKATHAATHLGVHHAKHIGHANPLLGLAVICTLGLVNLAFERGRTTGLKCKACGHKYY
jgi:translation initiation factor 2 beta subunit (eIF-2beta)/eIF-5